MEADNRPCMEERSRAAAHGREPVRSRPGAGVRERFGAALRTPLARPLTQPSPQTRKLTYSQLTHSYCHCPCYCSRCCCASLHLSVRPSAAQFPFSLTAAASRHVAGSPSRPPPQRRQVGRVQGICSLRQLERGQNKEGGTMKHTIGPLPVSRPSLTSRLCHVSCFFDWPPPNRSPRLMSR